MLPGLWHCTAQGGVNADGVGSLLQEEKELGWGGFDDVAPALKTTVVLRRMFAPEEFEADSALREQLQDDVGVEARKFGEATVCHTMLYAVTCADRLRAVCKLCQNTQDGCNATFVPICAHRPGGEGQGVPHQPRRHRHHQVS
jgi:hypothetical protein